MKYASLDVNGVKVAYRECGNDDKPVMVLFHGFPSASHMFRDLMPMLEQKFHLIAPDYPGFGQSDSPAREKFEYTFDHLAEIVDAFLEKKASAVFTCMFLITARRLVSELRLSILRESWEL